jgi:hypothetical protein
MVIGFERTVPMVYCPFQEASQWMTDEGPEDIQEFSIVSSLEGEDFVKYQWMYLVDLNVGLAKANLSISVIMLVHNYFWHYFWTIQNSHVY